VFSSSLKVAEWTNSTIVAEDPVDELNVTVYPVLLGNGTPMLRPGATPKRLALVSAEGHPSGAVSLSYAKA
jgi:hypothetical protein